MCPSLVFILELEVSLKVSLGGVCERDREEAGETALPLRSSITLARGPVFGSQHQVEFLSTTYNSSSKGT